MTYFKKYLIIVSFIILVGALFISNGLRRGDSNNDQSVQKGTNTPAENFNQDLNRAEDHWVHNRLGRQYSDSGNYEKAIEEYNKAIDVIQHSPGYEWPNLKKEDADRINEDAKIDTQIFPRYQLILAYEKAARYQEALEQIDWLLAYKPLPHVKEEL